MLPVLSVYSIHMHTHRWVGWQVYGMYMYMQCIHIFNIYMNCVCKVGFESMSVIFTHSRYRTPVRLKAEHNKPMDLFSSLDVYQQQ